MNNLLNFLQSKENQINLNLKTGEPNEEQLNNFIRTFNDQINQIILQAPNDIKRICQVIYFSSFSSYSPSLYFLLFSLLFFT